MVYDFKPKDKIVSKQRMLQRKVAFLYVANIPYIKETLQHYFTVMERCDLLQSLEAVFVYYTCEEQISEKFGYDKIKLIQQKNNIGELDTYQELWKFARENNDSNIIYLYVKQAINDNLNKLEEWIHLKWTHIIIHFNIEKWRDIEIKLQEYDTAGVDLIEEPYLHYSSNCWWAKASYIASLPEPYDFQDILKYQNFPDSKVHNNEFWIGHDDRAKHVCLFQTNVNFYQKENHQTLRDIYVNPMIPINRQLPKKLCIAFLTDSRRQSFFKIIVNNLLQCKYKNRILFLILTNDTDSIQKYEIFLKNKGLDTIICRFGVDRNYMNKIHFTIQTAEIHNIPYILKHDNDILCPPYVYDYLFEQCNILKNPKNLLLLPSLTNGTPTVDQFISDFLDEDEQEEMYNLFKEYTFGETWKVDYSSLNEYTIHANKWNRYEFLKGVRGINHHFKGVHPARLYEKATLRLNEIVLQNKEKIFTKGTPDLIYDSFTPYFCNGMFIMRTSTYKTIVNSSHLFRDGFDEIPINLYRNTHNLNAVYTKNAAAIHVAYNSLPNYEEVENSFIQHFTQENIFSFEDVLANFENVDITKGTDKHLVRKYGPIYTELFTPYKLKTVNVLEIGFGCGASLFALADYFYNGNIYGIDNQNISLELLNTNTRIHTTIANALECKNVFNKDYDIVIEDASHQIADQFQHFIDFLPFLKPGGLYIIEDITSENKGALESLFNIVATNNQLSLSIHDTRNKSGREDTILFVFQKQ